MSPIIQKHEIIIEENPEENNFKQKHPSALKKSTNRNEELEFFDKSTLKRNSSAFSHQRKNKYWKYTKKFDVGQKKFKTPKIKYYN